MNDNEHVILVDLVEERAMLLNESAVILARVDDLNTAIKAIDDSKPELDLSDYGLVRIKTLGSIGAGAVQVLKAKGLRDAVIVTEKVDSKRVNEYLASGELKEKDIAEFRGDGKDYLKNTKRGK